MAQGRTRSLAGLHAYMQAYEIRTCVKFAPLTDDKESASIKQSHVNSKRRLCWEHHDYISRSQQTHPGVDEKVNHCVVPFDGVPYLTMQTRKYRCRHTKCPAALIVKVVLKLPEAALTPGNSSEYARRECALRLREKLRSEDMSAQRWFYFSISRRSEHQGHIVPEHTNALVSCVDTPFGIFITLGSRGEIIHCQRLARQPSLPSDANPEDKLLAKCIRRILPVHTLIESIPEPLHAANCLKRRALSLEQSETSVVNDPHGRKRSTQPQTKQCKRVHVSFATDPQTAESGACTATDSLQQDIQAMAKQLSGFESRLQNVEAGMHMMAMQVQSLVDALCVGQPTVCPSTAILTTDRMALQRATNSLASIDPSTLRKRGSTAVEALGPMLCYNEEAASVLPDATTDSNSTSDVLSRGGAEDDFDLQQFICEPNDMAFPLLVGDTLTI